MPRDLGLILLAMICLIGDVVLAVLGHPIPPMLDTVTTVTVGAAAGATIPRAKVGY
jgi:hypothetical protein